MKFIKKHLCDLPRCYAVNSLDIGGRRYALAATEDDGPCYAFTGEKLDERLTVWEHPGGAMSFVPLEDKSGEFLAITKFYRIYNWEEAEISWAYPDGNGGFALKSVVNLPYIHRFDVLETAHGAFFIGCTLAVKKDSVEDWSTPGRIYVGRLDKKRREITDLEVLRDDVRKNHGYLRQQTESGPRSLIGCRDGIFAVAPPRESGGAWTVEKLAGFPVSDLALCDIDGDGVEELATIEPFHGCRFRIYKRAGGGWRRVYEHPEICEFYHVIWGGALGGVPAFIGGGRRGTRALFAVTYENGGFASHEIDSGVGPANVHVMHRETGDVIISSNMEKGEAAAYFVGD